MPYTNDRELEQLDAQIKAVAHVEQQLDDEAAQALEEHRRELDPPPPGEPERPGLLARALGAVLGVAAPAVCPTCAGSCQIPNEGPWASPPEEPIAIRCARGHYCATCHLDEQARERDPRPTVRPCWRCWGQGKLGVPLRARQLYAEQLRAWDVRDGKKPIFWRFEGAEDGAW